MKNHLLLLGICAVLVLRLTSAANTAKAAPIAPKRTLPKVTPPGTGLEFSRMPTVQEISRARVFEEPLVPIGGEPTAAENADLAVALLGNAQRSGPDDFASFTGFLDRYPNSPWRAALLTDLGLDYYKTARYSLALAAWREAWELSRNANSADGKCLADRSACELAGLYSRLGRMTELEALLASVESRTFIGGASERIKIAREALTMMKYQPQVSFRCGPLALQSIKRSLHPGTPVEPEIRNSASTQQGFSLTQVAELSKKVGLNYQMAFRTVSHSLKSESVSLIVPSVVHWKSGHYAAIVRQEGDRYLIEDPTFNITVLATKQALESEASGYFLIPSGNLPAGWRSVEAQEGNSVWGKGTTSFLDANQYACNNHQTKSCASCAGMAIASAHLMLANYQIRDTPVGYTPPVGPPIRFTVRYNYRDIIQPAGGVSKLLGPKWTHDWNEYLAPAGANINYVVGGGGVRIFTGFDTNTQAFAPNQYDQTLLHVTSPSTFEMVWPDGSKKIFGPFNNGSGYLLSEVRDRAGNAVTLSYDGQLRLVALTDAIGQVTTISYENADNSNLITKVTDPFGRFATFEYANLAVPMGADNNCSQPGFFVFFRTDFLVKITDVLGLESQFSYQGAGSSCPDPIPPGTNGIPLFNDSIVSMTTPYGITYFSAVTGTKTDNGATTPFRDLTISYPDGSSERVVCQQTSDTGIPNSDPPASVPTGMTGLDNGVLYGRNTYYWSRAASAVGAGSYSQAKVFHWLHTEDMSACSGILESVKEPLEGRVWFDYAGSFNGVVGSTDQPAHIGRVLDDGQTQLHTRKYDAFGHMTNSVDPLGRTFTFLYSTNGVDLLEIHQTRAVNNELLFRGNYNSQHRLLTSVDASGQTNTFTYNARGQPLSIANPKGETTTYTYDTNGYLIAVDGPLPDTSDTVTAIYDFFGRMRTLTGVSGYTLTFDYDAMDRITKITHPDGTFEQLTYNRLDLVTARDRAARQTVFEYDNMRQLKKRTDPLNRITRFDWCRCGNLGSLTDPQGRTTSWITDVQGRLTAKRYSDGSEITCQYENTSSRLRFAIDERQQITQFAWNRDNTLKSIAYASAVIPTPGVNFFYDPNYVRVVSMIDGTGTTRYSYNPITETPSPGAGALATVDGPQSNDTATYGYDELGRIAHRAINGVDSDLKYDAAGRLIGVSNALGSFAYAYDGPSGRPISKSFPNGQSTELAYGNNRQDKMLQRITHRFGATPISEFLYSHDATKARITTWSQQAGAQPPDLFSFGYDGVDQLLSAAVTNSGVLANTFAYSYDSAGNRLTEQVGASSQVTTYNGLNQISTTTAPGGARSNEWDAQNRLVAVNAGNQRTEFVYDGQSRPVTIRKLVNGSEASFRRLVWLGFRISEERDAGGAVTKRFFPQGVKIETGPNAGKYFYTRDHLGSIRALTDNRGGVRARYIYDPYGRRVKQAGDLESDFGFAGMYFAAEANLALTRFRAYDPELGRWLSRDPLPNAEGIEGPNLYTYVGNEPISRFDPLGLCTGTTLCKCFTSPQSLAVCQAAGVLAKEAVEHGEELAGVGEGATVACEAGGPAAEAILPKAAEAIEGTVQTLIPQAAPVSQVAQSAPGVNTLAGPFLNTLAIDEALMDTEMGELEAETSELYEAAWEWFHRVNAEGRGAREQLSTIEEKMEDIGLLFKMQDLLFFPSGR